jgi:hypothetical protein
VYRFNYRLSKAIFYVPFISTTTRKKATVKTEKEAHTCPEKEAHTCPERRIYE